MHTLRIAQRTQRNTIMRTHAPSLQYSHTCTTQYMRIYKDYIRNRTHLTGIMYALIRCVGGAQYAYAALHVFLPAPAFSHMSYLTTTPNELHYHSFDFHTWIPARRNQGTPSKICSLCIDDTSLSYPTSHVAFHVHEHASFSGLSHP